MSTFSASVVFSAIDRITAPVKRMANTTKSFAGTATESFSKVAERSSNLTKRVDGLCSKMVNLKNLIAGTAIVAGAKSLFNMALDYARANDAQIKSAQRLGLSLQTYKELGYAAKMSGMNAEEFGKSFDRFSKNVGAAKLNTGSLTNFLMANDRSLLNTLKHSKSSESAFMAYAQAASRIKDPMLRATFVSQAFGARARSINNLLSKGSAGIQALREEYRRLAGTNANAAMSTAELVKAQKRMETATSAVKNSILSAAITSIIKVMEKTADWTSTNRVMLKTQISKYVRGFANIIVFLIKHLNIIIPVIGLYVGTLIALKSISLASTLVTWGMVAAKTALNVVLGTSVFLTGAWTTAALASTTATKTAIGLEKAWTFIKKGSTVATWAMTVAQKAWNAACDLNPVIKIIAGILLLIVVIAQLIKHWDSVKKAGTSVWNALKIAWNATCKFIMSGIGLLGKGFTGLFHGIVQVYKIVGAFIYDIILMPIKSILFLISKIPGVGSKFKEFSNNLQKLTGKKIMFGSESDKKNESTTPVNKDAAIITQKKIMESNNNQHVQINIDDNTGRARLGGQVQPVPIYMRSTRWF